MRRWAVVSVLLFSMIAASVGAIAEGAAGKSLSPGETDRQPPDTIAIEAHGESVIYGGDIPTARDEAITRAKVHALEKAIGTRIEDRFITQDSLLLHSYVKLETGGVVRAFRVVRESGDGANYVVDIEAWIVKGKDAQNAKLGDLMSNTSIIVAIPETTLGEPASTRYIQESLEEAMTHERFHLLDANQAAAIRAKEAELHRIDGDPQAARRIGLKYLSNIIVKGDVACRPRQINGKIHSGGTDATVKAVVADTAHMPFSISRRQEKGYGLNYEEACEQSREKAAEKVAAEVIENLRDYLNASKRRDRGRGQQRGRRISVPAAAELHPDVSVGRGHHERQLQRRVEVGDVPRTVQGADGVSGQPAGPLERLPLGQLLRQQHHHQSEVSMAKDDFDEFYRLLRQGDTEKWGQLSGLVVKKICEVELDLQIRLDDVQAGAFEDVKQSSLAVLTKAINSGRIKEPRSLGGSYTEMTVRCRVIEYRRRHRDAWQRAKARRRNEGEAPDTDPDTSLDAEVIEQIPGTAARFGGGRPRPSQGSGHHLRQSAQAVRAVPAYSGSVFPVQTGRRRPGFPGGRRAGGRSGSWQLHRWSEPLPAATSQAA